ncbi:MAG: biotin/lipoyl-binding protein, partial [Cellvibrionales bacterium]|nr:biotin/lipoyl-binding protein [Cellvibrionales bacterium]
MNTQKIRVPDIGADSAQVTEILVAVGDDLQTEQSLLVLESDKASVEVPAPLSGRVRTILVTEGQQVAEGTELLEVEVAADSTDPASSEAPQKPAEPAATEQSNDAPEPQESQTPPP